jgi:uncharacterized protein (UPF0335 family)
MSYPENTSDDVAAIADRAIRLLDLRDENASDLAELWKEAKSAGFDTNVLKSVVKAHRANTIEEVRETHSLFDVYVNAIQGRRDAV